MVVLSQRDPRWANIKLGTSGVTIGGYGCTITCLAMLCGLTPNQVNEILKSNGGYQNGNLVIWAKVNLLPGLQFEWRNYTYNSDADNARVKDAITKYGGCMVEVDFDGTPRTDDRHWVVYVGNGKIYDPWTGKIESTSKYPALGFCVIKRTSPPAQTPSQPTETPDQVIQRLRNQLDDLDHQKRDWEEKATQLQKALDALNLKLTTIRSMLSNVINAI